MKQYFLILVCFAVQMYGMEQSIESWSNSPTVREGFEQFLGKICSYKTEPLAGGLLSDAPCVCTVNDNKYVARIFKGLPDSRKTKIAINCLVADKGIAPKIYHHGHHDDFSFAIMDFIDIPTLSFEQANDQKTISFVAQHVKHIAQFDLNLVTSNKETLFVEIMRHYESVKNKKVISLDAVLEEIKHKTEIVQQEINQQKRPLVIGHNDLHPRNMFFVNNGIVIIDWDTIAPNYEFGDLAAHSIFSCLNKKNDLYLLSQYLQNVPSQSDVHYFKMVKLLGRASLVLSFFEYVQSIPKSDESIQDFEYYATAFAQGTGFDSAEFFYECGMSQLKELRREYESFFSEL